MEKIDIDKLEFTVIAGNPSYVIALQLQHKINEIIDHLTILDKLAIRVARLEVYYKAHRKEHGKRTR